MAVEDGKMAEMRKQIIDNLVSSRKASFEEMMNSLEGKGYEIVSVREEAGFTARMAIKSRRDGAARGILIIAPGGGFMFKSWNEALPVTEFFYESGLNVAILDYHVKGYADMNVFSQEMRMAGEDGLQAIRYLRENAEKYNIDPEHIAIGGFSAGGMLAGYAATRFDASSRPDAALILYGAFSQTQSVPSLTGGLTREQMVEANKLDNIRHISVNCPPMFVFQTHEDDPRIALNFCMELAVHGVPYEIHTFERGAHGGGLYNGLDETPNEPHTAKWASLAADWLQMHGW